MDSCSGSWTYSKYVTIIKVTSSALWLKSSLGDLPIYFPITLFWKISIMTSIVKVNCNWLFVRGIHRSPVNSPHKGQWRGALMFFYLRPYKRFSKQWRGWWFETPLCTLWRHCNWHVCYSTLLQKCFKKRLLKRSFSKYNVWVWWIWNVLTTNRPKEPATHYAV